MEKNQCDGCILPCAIPIDHIDEEFQETADNYNSMLELKNYKCPCSTCLLKMRCSQNCQDYLDHLSYIWSIVK